MFRQLDDNILVAPQIAVADVADAKARGVTLVINNRPEGEAPDQTPGDDIEAAVRAAGLDYIAIPITHSGFSEPQVKAMVKIGVLIILGISASSDEWWAVTGD